MILLLLLFTSIIFITYGAISIDIRFVNIFYFNIRCQLNRECLRGLPVKVVLSTTTALYILPLTFPILDPQKSLGAQTWVK